MTKPISLCRTVGVLTLTFVATASLLGQVQPILAPAKRIEALQQARALLEAKQFAASPANPFVSETFDEVRLGSSGSPSVGEEAPRPVTPVGPKSNRDLLQSIATSLKPSGFFVIGGTPTLVFGQKRVKAGGLLTITYEGKEYTLEVSALDRTNFTLRLNREEFTRPIK